MISVNCDAESSSTAYWLLSVRQLKCWWARGAVAVWQ